MKKIVFTISILCSAGILFSQNTGTVTYKETRKLHFDFPGNAPPPPDLPKENINKTILFFTDAASLYMNDTVHVESQNIDEETEDGMHIRMIMDQPDNQVYCDLANKTTISQENFMQRKFLVERPMDISGWKLTGQQKMIMHYPCMEAVKEDSTQKISVWFTSAIPVASGPLDYVGLPGLVLEVNINDGEQLITVTSLTKETDIERIKKPKDGKKVSAEEYDAIVAEKMKEMGIEQHGGGNIILRINDN